MIELIGISEERCFEASDLLNNRGINASCKKGTLSFTHKRPGPCSAGISSTTGGLDSHLSTVAIKRSPGCLKLGLATMDYTITKAC